MGTIRGNHITDNKGDGIRLVASFSINITQNRIEFNEGCGILISNSSHDIECGKNRIKANDKHGIHILDSSNNTVKDNVVWGNSENGIEIEGSSFLKQITLLGNYIGIDDDGETTLPNRCGISIIEWVTQITIGGVHKGEGNVISGNTECGILIDGQGSKFPSEEIEIMGNCIGTDGNGMGARGNNVGVNIRGVACKITIGGEKAASANTISGNREEGIYLGFVQDVSIIGNNIGTNIDGSIKIPNKNGIVITKDSSFVTVEKGNIISGNTETGINITGPYPSSTLSGIKISGNHIGVNKAGDREIPNRIGVQISKGYKSCSIGRMDGGEANIISGNTECGILITDRDTSFHNVQGNLIGTDKEGKNAIPNRDGIRISSDASFNTIGGIGDGMGNLISGNIRYGIFIGDNSDERDSYPNSVTGNIIGTNKDGMEPIKNGIGVYLKDAGVNNTIGPGNTISGNDENGIELRGGTHATRICGNLIGTNVDGTSAVPNGNAGIGIYGRSSINFIGTDKEKGWTRNVISGNSGNGVEIKDSDYNYIQGNFIGCDKGGLLGLPNERNGILISNGKWNNIGKTEDITSKFWTYDIDHTENLISGNRESGINIEGPGSSGNDIRGNLIGVGRFGNEAMSNREGITILGGAHKNSIGYFYDPDICRGNIISGNSMSGVRIADLGSSGNKIWGNVIGMELSMDSYAKAIPNGNGVCIGPYADLNIIGDDNIIAGNTGTGVMVGDGTGRGPRGTRVQDNRIGWDYWDMRRKSIGNAIGVHLNGCSLTHVYDNLFRYNCRAIVDEDPPGTNFFQGNHMWYNTCSSSGIHLVNSSAMIIGNTIIDDAGDGIFCTNGSAPLIGYNTIYNNSGYDINNTDSNVTIDARYNYWGPGGGAGRVGGKVDTSSPLSSGEVVVDMAELNGTNVSGFFNDELIIGYSVSAPVIIIVIRLQDSPVGELEDYIGDYYVIMVNDTSKVNEMNITSCYLDVDWYADPASVHEFMWWTGSEWKACSDAEQNLTLSGDFSIRCVWIRVGEGTIPAQGNLAELLIGIAAVSDGEDDEEEDNHQGLALLLVIIVVVLFVLLVLVVREKITLGERPDTREKMERGNENDWDSPDGKVSMGGEKNKPPHKE